MTFVEAVRHYNGPRSELDPASFCSNIHTHQRTPHDPYFQDVLVTWLNVNYAKVRLNRAHSVTSIQL